MKKKIKLIGIILLAVLVVYFVFEHILLVDFAKTLIKYTVDLKTHMNRVTLNPFKGRITIKGLKIFNPPEFKDQIIAKIPTVVINFNKKTLFEEGTFLDRIIIHLKELNIIRNKEDVVNLSKVKALTPQEKSNNNGPFSVSSCIIEIGEVNYIDYTKNEEGEKETFVIEEKEEYNKIRDPERIGRLVAFKIFFNSKLKNIGVDILKIQKDLAKLAENNQKLAEQLEKLKQTKDEGEKKEIEGKIEKIQQDIDKIEGKTKEDVAAPAVSENINNDKVLNRESGDGK